MMTGASSVYNDQQQQVNSIRMGSPIGLRDPSPAYRSSPSLLQQQQQQQQQLQQQDLRMTAAPSTTSSSIGSSLTSSLFGTSAIRFRSPGTQHNQQQQQQQLQHGSSASDQNFRDERYCVQLLLLPFVCIDPVFELLFCVRSTPFHSIPGDASLRRLGCGEDCNRLDQDVRA